MRYGEFMLMGTEFVLDDEKVPDMDVGDGCTTM